MIPLFVGAGALPFVRGCGWGGCSWLPLRPLAVEGLRVFPLSGMRARGFLDLALMGSYCEFEPGLGLPRALCVALLVGAIWVRWKGDCIPTPAPQGREQIV